MTRDEILDLAAEAMAAKHTPRFTELSPEWQARAIAMYRDRFVTGLAAAEAHLVDHAARSTVNRIARALDADAAHWREQGMTDVANFAGNVAGNLRKGLI